MSEGLTNREIADRLYIGVETVRWYAKQFTASSVYLGARRPPSKQQRLGLLNVDAEQIA